MVPWSSDLFISTFACIRSHFNVTIYPPYSLKQEIIKLLEEFTKKNSKYKEDDSVIVAVLSHGEEKNGKHILHNYHSGYSNLSLARLGNYSRIHRDGKINNST